MLDVNRINFRSIEMKFKNLILPFLFLLPVDVISLPSQGVIDSPAIEIDTKSTLESEEDLNRKKLENILRLLVTRCEPFPKCL